MRVVTIGTDRVLQAMLFMIFMPVVTSLLGVDRELQAMLDMIFM